MPVSEYVAVALVSLLVGALYAVARVRSPAPPPVAIPGLAAMLVATTVLRAL